MKIVYFAWVRERIGEPSETYEGAASTVSEVLDELAERSQAHALAFSDREVLKFAADQKLVDAQTAVKGVSELAVFPPMTGG